MIIKHGTRIQSLEKGICQNSVFASILQVNLPGM